MAPQRDPLFSVSLSQENLSCAYHAFRRELVSMIAKEAADESVPLEIRRRIVEQYLVTMENLGFARAQVALGDTPDESSNTPGEER
jgi:hypothetical protein